MAVAVWKGRLRFGLLTLAVKLYRAAKAEKISFRQLQKTTGARVLRHTLSADVVHADAPIARAGIPAGKSVHNSRPNAPSAMLAANAQENTERAPVKREDLERLRI